MARATTKRKTAEKSKTTRREGQKTRAADARQSARKSDDGPETEAPAKRGAKSLAKKSRSTAGTPAKATKAEHAAAKRKSAPRKVAAKSQARSGARKKRA